MYQTEFKTYKFYNKQGQRLAIFAQNLGSKLDVFVLRCSPQDQFNKAKAAEVYQLYKDGMYDTETGAISRLEEVRPGVQEMKNYHPVHFTVNLEDKTRPRGEFMNFCFKNYYRKVVVESFVLSLQEEEILAKW